MSTDASHMYVCSNFINQLEMIKVLQTIKQ